MTRSFLVCCFLLLGTVAPALDIGTVLPGASLRGEAVLRVLGFPLYRARLYTPGGAQVDWNADLAIDLTYLRYLSEGDLVDSTLDEFERIGGALPLRGALTECLSDVQKGDRYTAVSRGENRVIILFNGRQTCTLAYPGIRRRFMEVFVGNNTRSPPTSRLLRGD